MILDGTGIREQCLALAFESNSVMYETETEETSLKDDKQSSGGSEIVS